jgi:release factor glutamine methyltransferase
VTELVTTQAMLRREATAILDAAGIAEPRREALRLARDLEHRDATRLVLDADQLASPAEAERYLAAVHRRAAGEPLAYVTGWSGFRRLDLLIDRRVLIPRPETEELVGAALDRVRGGVAADIGTGSGAIAIALASEGRFAEVIGTDNSADALAVARENSARNEVAVTWLEGDLLRPIRGRRLDLLVSNPPYLTDAEYDTLDPSVRAWEPRQALVGGEDGMSAYQVILAGGRSLLQPTGWLALEIDARRAVQTQTLAEGFGWREVTILDDLFGRARILLAQRGADND